MSNLRLTQEMFEASKILAPAICRGRASLFFDGYGIRKWLSIRGSSCSGKNPYMIFKLENEFKKTIYQYPLADYMGLEWTEVKELLRYLGNESNWITLNGNKEKVK